jgi:hypothetical protein
LFTLFLFLVFPANLFFMFGHFLSMTLSPARVLLVKSVSYLVIEGCADLFTVVLQEPQEFIWGYGIVLV